MSLRYPALVLACLLGGATGASAQPDLELAFAAADPAPDVYTTFTVELALTNAGDVGLDAAAVTFQLPGEVTLVGQGEGYATQGDYRPYERRWDVGALAAGETATLYINLFNQTGTAKRLFAEVATQRPADRDSAPGNGTPPAPVEDDEAALLLNGGVGPTCDLEVRVFRSACRDLDTADPLDDRYDAFVVLTGASGGVAFATARGFTKRLTVGDTSAYRGLFIVDGPIDFTVAVPNDPSCTVRRSIGPPSACSTPPAPGACADNVLANGGFENTDFALRGWRLNDYRSYRIVDAAYEGTAALSLRGDDFLALYQTVEAEPGGDYELSFALREPLGNASGSAHLKYLSATYQVLGRSSLLLDTLPRLARDEYQVVGLRGQAPPDARYVEVRVERYGGPGVAYFDGFCLRGPGVDACANDDVAPTIEFCPQDIVVRVPAGTASAPVARRPPTSRDNCPGAVALAATATPGDTFALGATTVRHTATDAAGNVNACSFEVRVVEVAAQPTDLRLTRVLPVFRVRPGISSRIGFTVSNDGGAALPNGVLAEAYLSVDPVLSADDVAVGRADLSGVAPGRSDVFLDYTVAPNTPYGEYFVVVAVDVDDVVPETDEANNVRSVPVEVGAFCFGASAFPWHEWISEVAFDGFAQASGKSTYSSFPSRPIVYALGDSAAYAFATEFSYVSSVPHYAVYVDVDRDATLDASELWFTAVGPRPPSGAGAVSRVAGVTPLPAGIGPGVHLLRVVMRRGAFPVRPCGSIDYGEIEDYLLEVVEPTPLQRALRRAQPGGTGELSAGGGGGGLLLRPNPARYGYVSVAAPGLAAQRVEVRLVDALSREVARAARGHHPGVELELALDAAPAGLYRVLVVPERGRALAAPLLVED